MASNSCTVFEHSKLSMIFLAFGSLLFVALGIGLFILEPNVKRPVDAIFTLVLCTDVAFFGFCLLYAVKRIVDNKPGLVISNAGIEDHSSAIAVGFIPWQDISGLSVKWVLLQPCLVIHFDNPSQYLSRGNVLQRFAKMINNILWGSPVLVSDISLRVSFDEMVAAIKDNYNVYKSA